MIEMTRYFCAFGAILGLLPASSSCPKASRTYSEENYRFECRTGGRFFSGSPIVVVMTLKRLESGIPRQPKGKVVLTIVGSKDGKVRQKSIFVARFRRPGDAGNTWQMEIRNCFPAQDSDRFSAITELGMYEIMTTLYSDVGEYSSTSSIEITDRSGLK